MYNYEPEEFTREETKQTIAELLKDVFITLWIVQYSDYLTSSRGYDCDFEGLCKDFAQLITKFAEDPAAVKEFENVYFYNEEPEE